MSEDSDLLFRPRRASYLLTGAVLAVMLAIAGWYDFDAVIYFGPVLAGILTLVTLLQPGIEVTDDGLNWFILRPQWRYRFVPWTAIRELKRSFFGIGDRIRLICEPGRFHRPIWGTKARPRVIELSRRSFVRGGELIEWIESVLSERQREQEFAERY